MPEAAQQPRYSKAGLSCREYLEQSEDFDKDWNLLATIEESAGKEGGDQLA